MKFKDFISRERVGIFIVGIGLFAASLWGAKITGYASLGGELFIDLAAAVSTIVFTALIIDYLSLRERSNRTRNAAGLAEDEITATCFRIKWRMARLFGLEAKRSGRENISSRSEAREYLERARKEVNSYLSAHPPGSKDTPLVESMLPKYIERLQKARDELEQTLLLYEYAMDYSLRERVLSLRSELQVADNILGFVDVAEKLNDANASLVRVLSQTIYDTAEELLGHDSRINLGDTISDKNTPLA